MGGSMAVAMGAPARFETRSVMVVDTIRSPYVKISARYDVSKTVAMGIDDSNFTVRLEYIVYDGSDAVRDVVGAGGLDSGERFIIVLRVDCLQRYD